MVRPVLLPMVPPYSETSGSSVREMAANGQRGLGLPAGELPRRFYITEPGKYSWEPDRTLVTTDLPPNAVRVVQVDEKPSRGTFSAYHHGTYAKLTGYTDRANRIHYQLEPDDALRPDEQYPHPLGYAAGVRILESTHSDYPVGAYGSADITFGDQTVVYPEKNPNALWLPDQRIHPSLHAIIRKMGPITANAVLHLFASEPFGGFTNLTLDDMREIAKDKRVLVSGAGTFGVNAANMLRWLGTEQVVIADIDPLRGELAHKTGLQEVVNPRNLPGGFRGRKAYVEYMKRVAMPVRPGNRKDAKYGPGPNGIIDFSGRPEALDNEIDIVKAKGIIVVGGMLPRDIVLQNTFQFHTGGPTIVSAQTEFVPQSQDEEWGQTRNPLSGLFEKFLRSQDPSRYDGGTYGDTVSEVQITHVGTFSEAEQMYPHIMTDNVRELRPWGRRPRTSTTGYVSLLNDRLPLEVRRWYHPDSPMPPGRQPQRERIEIGT